MIIEQNAPLDQNKLGTFGDSTPREDEEKRAEEEAAKEAAAKEAAAKEAAAREAAAKEAADKEAADKEAAAKEAAAKEAEVPGLPLTFRDPSGQTYSVTFTTKPLCMDFRNNTKPVKIAKSFGTAKRLGVLEGSELIKVDDTDVEELAFTKILGLISQKIAPLPADGLTISFRDGTGASKQIVFPTKPLGMDFETGRKPIKVEKSAGIAKSLGVLVGWEVVAVAGNPIEQLEFDKALELISEKIGALPARD